MKLEGLTRLRAIGCERPGEMQSRLDRICAAWTREVIVLGQGRLASRKAARVELQM
jgi:hypothetical protein